MTQVSAWSQTEKPDSTISLISSAGFHHGLDSSRLPPLVPNAALERRQRLRHGCEVYGAEHLKAEHSRGMTPRSTSCSRVLRCCRQSWRTGREQRHGGQGGGGDCHHPEPNPLSHLATICGFNRQTCQASDSTKYLLSPDQSATSKRPGGEPRHRHPIHFLHEYHKLYNSWTSIPGRHWLSCPSENVDLSRGSTPEENRPLMFNVSTDKRNYSSDNQKGPNLRPVNVQRRAETWRKRSETKTLGKYRRLVFKKRRSMKEELWLCWSPVPA